MDHNFGAVIVFLVLVVTLDRSGGRELRPSYHGLAYQEDSSSPPAQNGDAQEMLSFFGAAETSSSPPVQLPEAKNISDTWWSAHAEGMSRDVWRDHVRLGLLVGSGVCGLIGVVLLAVSGIVFLVRLQKPKPEAERIPSTSASASVARSHDAVVNEKL